MTRLHIACLCLVASALVLSGLLVVQVSQRTEPNEAEAALVIARENFTLLTAPTRDDEEALFVLDNSSGMLLVYRLEIAREQMVLSDRLNVGELFDMN